MSVRTKRKNRRKREQRRVLTAIQVRLHQDEWTNDAMERELMQNEEDSQHVHDQWSHAVLQARIAFDKKKRISDERKRLLIAIRKAIRDENETSPSN